MYARILIWRSEMHWKKINISSLPSSFHPQSYQTGAEIQKVKKGDTNINIGNSDKKQNLTFYHTNFYEQILKKKSLPSLRK